MKNILIASVISLVLIVGASQSVQALTTTEVQAQMQALLQRVADLTNQLNLLRGSQGQMTSGSSTASSQPAFAHRICSLVMRSFTEGSQGDDVRAFQEFLQSEGYLTVTPTGYYGPMTRQALMRWQAAQGFESAGVIGPKTMERIRMKCGNASSNDNTGRLTALPTNGTAPLTVTFSHYVGGYRPASISYLLNFGDGTSERATECPAPADACTGPGTNTHTYTANGTYTVTLSRLTNPCAGMETVCRAAVQSEIIGKVQVSVGSGPVACTKEYKPVCGAKTIYCITTPCNPVPTTYNNRCTMSADNASYLYEGQCSNTATDPADNPQCKNWDNQCNVCSRQYPGGPAICTMRACATEGYPAPRCTSYFDSTSNRAPSISGLSGPTTLAVNETGTWTVTASDPENGPLSYSVNWGELSQMLNSASVGSSAQFNQSTTFTHSYSSAGTYVIGVTVSDREGLAAKTTTTVKVGDGVICTADYTPVCGRPSGCANTCAVGQVCPAICQLKEPQTYGNRCVLNGAGAQYLHQGQCTSSSGNWY